MTVLHIFPTSGSWSHTEEVHVLHTAFEYTVTQAHRDAVRVSHRGILQTQWRDSVFALISLPQARDIFEDIIMYADPYTESFCDFCEDFTFAQYGECDLCGSA